MAAAGITYESVIRDLRKKQYRPIYYLMGEEDYFIDKISNFIIDNVLTETEKDFNLTVVYGSDIEDFVSVVNMAKRYPMMAEHQVVVVKEAQNIDNMDALEPYLEKPQPSTILVVCHKHGVLDRRKKIASLIQEKGVLFESKKWRDNQMPTFINEYVASKQVNIDPKATSMLVDYVGADISRMVGELDKLIITIDVNTKCITPDDVANHIGISKEYNTFELINALQIKNVLKANTIINYFASNPKNNPVQITIAALFNYYSNLMLAYYAPDKTETGLTSYLGLRNSWQARNYVTGLKYYNAWHVMRIISYIRNADAASKGVDSASISNADIMRELIFKILH
jgi:DNA polymerase-3 subunit delta